MSEEFCISKAAWKPYERDAKNNAQRRNDVNAMADRFGSLETRSSSANKQGLLYSRLEGSEVIFPELMIRATLWCYRIWANKILTVISLGAPTVCHITHMLPRSVRLISLAPSVNLLKVIMEASNVLIPSIIRMTIEWPLFMAHIGIPILLTLIRPIGYLAIGTVGSGQCLNCRQAIGRNR